MLEDEVKQANKIKVGATVPRYDCISYTGNKDALKPFITKKGLMYLRLMESKEFVKADRKRMADFALVGTNSLNLTSLYQADEVDGQYFGYPNGKPFLKDGSPNPMFPFRNDLYLVQTDATFKIIEVLVLPNQKAYALELAQAFAGGDFEDTIDVMRAKAQTFYNYEK